MQKKNNGRVFLPILFFRPSPNGGERMHATRNKTIAITVGILPALIIYLIFAILPILQSFYYSLMEWDGFSAMQYVGLDNFKALFQDPLFWNSLKNNIYVVLASVLGQVPIALFIALLLNRKIKGLKLFRTIGFFYLLCYQRSLFR